MEILAKVQTVVVVALGLGFVIFLHELGHFLVAKWCRVRVLRFSIGFGPILLSYRRGMGVQVGSSTRAYDERIKKFKPDDPEVRSLGETEYALSAIPLGGYVKMLGENPDEDRTEDPRAYANRPVGARMAIISAGVIMNLILGWVCFTGVYLRGKPEIPTRIGYVITPSPAYAAGVRPGDEVVAVDGRRDLSFDELMRIVALSGHGQAVRFELKRAGRSGLIAVDLRPERLPNSNRPLVGIGLPEDVELATRDPYDPPPGMGVAKVEGFQGGDRVIAIGPEGQAPTPVETADDVKRLLAEWRDRPVDVVVRRKETGERATVRLPVNRFLSLGFVPEIGPVTAIQGDSPASRAGFRIGDRILKVDGRADFDPLRLPTDMLTRVGKPVPFEVERRDPKTGATEVVTLTATPEPAAPWLERIDGSEPLEVPSLGLAYPILPKVARVEEGSAAARAGLRPGQAIRSLTVNLPGPKGQEKTFTFGPGEPGLAFVFHALQELPAGPISLAVGDPKAPPVRYTLAPDPTWPNPQRGLQFVLLQRDLPPQGLVRSVQRGARETLENVTSIYATIRGLVQQRLSPENLGGPIKIADIAYGAARMGFTAFLSFLGILSVNLAVINFLPIVPLDGGQMVYLIAERIRGRPLPEKAQLVGLFVGLVFVVALILFSTFNDISSYFR